MNRKNSKPKEGVITPRENGLIVAREFNRVMRTFNKVLNHKEINIKSLDSDLQGLTKRLKENQRKQKVCDRYYKIVDNNSEKIRLDLQHLKGEESAHVAQYERLLTGIGGESPESERTADTKAISDNDDNIDILEIFRIRKESYLESLNQEFDNLEEKLRSIENVRNELEESCNELKPKRARVLEKKEALEGDENILLNEVGRLESDLETTTREESILTEELVKMVKQVENGLELDEKIDHILISSLAQLKSSKTSSASGTSSKGAIKRVNFLRRVNKK